MKAIIINVHVRKHFTSKYYRSKRSHYHFLCQNLHSKKQKLFNPCAITLIKSWCRPHKHGQEHARQNQSAAEDAWGSRCCKSNKTIFAMNGRVERLNAGKKDEWGRQRRGREGECQERLSMNCVMESLESLLLAINTLCD